MIIAFVGKYWRKAALLLLLGALVTFWSMAGYLIYLMVQGALANGWL